MILVLLGTFPLSFQRPLFEIEKLLQDHVIVDQVIVQSGHTTFQSNLMTIRPFLSLEELMELYERADLIITQAGTGSIVKGLKLGKKIIAIARLAKYGECVDDHQLELLKELAEANYLIPWHEGDELSDIILKANTYKPLTYHSTNKEIINYLIDYIDSI